MSVYIQAGTYTDNDVIPHTSFASKISQVIGEGNDASYAQQASVVNDKIQLFQCCLIEYTWFRLKGAGTIPSLKLTMTIAKAPTVCV